MAVYRDLPRTLLPLDRWAQILGIDPRHFRQITTVKKPVTTCAHVWKQYSWQESDQVGRYDVATAIQQAENNIAQLLGFKLLPTYFKAERQQTPKPGNVELYNLSGYDPAGYRLAVQAKWGYFVQAGQEAKSVIVAGTAVTYSDEDADGYFETATISFATTVTDEEEIAVFYPGESGADKWEIRPLRTVSITGGVCTVTMWRHQLVLPDLIEALDPEAADGDTAADFLTTVDVYRRYNDPETQVSLIWVPNYWCGCSTDESDCCPTCGTTTQTGCLVAKDSRRGWLMYKPATYADGSWSNADLSCGRNPDIVSLYYRAGLKDESRDWPHLQMDPQWERAVAYYALTLLDREVCECSPVRSLFDKMREDLARGGQGAASFQLSDAMVRNPLGTTRAAMMAWNMVNDPERRISRPVNY